jgi:hypothetical protein
MRVTLHQGASNTYYGQWILQKAAIWGSKSRSIAHNGPAARPNLPPSALDATIPLGIEARPVEDLHWLEKQTSRAKSSFP